MKILTVLISFAGVFAASAAEYHVAVTGNDANDGSAKMPFKTISAAALWAQPGDLVTVHKGIYRERIDPLRGGLSETKRITYQAAPGETVVLTGSEIAKGWEKVSGDTWKVVLPNSYFADYNPYADTIHGDWFSPQGREHHTGCVYLNGDWMIEAAHFDDVLKPAGKTPLWFAKVDGGDPHHDEPNHWMMNLASVHLDTGTEIHPERPSARFGTQNATRAEGQVCVGWIEHGDWLRYNGVNFGSGTTTVTLRVSSQTEGGNVELRLGNSTGELLGTATVNNTGGWENWTLVDVKIKPVSGINDLCLVFRNPKVADPTTSNTTIFAQFPGGVDPNKANVEINKRPVVFYPSKNFVNYITVRGFILENAATNWAPPSAEQQGIVGTNWSKGWIIENNEVRYSKCCGISLGKYGDEYDNTNGAGAADPYTACVHRALMNGWNKETVGSHLVRNNYIHHCEQTGIVGSMGCAFSTVTGNEIHDIHVRQLFSGAEMAGIKFHGAIDVTIHRNHIYRCGEAAGIWLDWMAQGAQVTGNLLHDNTGGCGDIFCEMQHGPILIANNLVLSPHKSFALNSQGIAFAHNLILGPFTSYRGDTRATPVQEQHSTAIAEIYPSAKGDSGDHRFYNNILVAPCNLPAFNNAALPCFAGGNVFLKGAQPAAFDKDDLVKADFNPGVALTKKADGWYLSIREDAAWRSEAPRKLVTSDLLGAAKVSGERFENPDCSPVRIAVDYFGRARDKDKPFPGPFEISSKAQQEFKVWPVQP